MIEAVDHQIIHGLQCAPRASYRLIGQIIGVSEQTVARRYRRLRADGVVRVLGLVEPAARGQAQWIARIRCRPDQVTSLAAALARRPEVAFVSISSGGSQVMCTIRSPVHTPHDEVLLQQLPRASSVLDVSIDLVLHRFLSTRADDWGVTPRPLSPQQINDLVQQYGASRPTVAEPASVLVEPTGADEALLGALATDGRAGFADLAAITGSSPARVAARMEALESGGALYYDVDLLPEQLGYDLEANVWLRVGPPYLQATGTEIAAHDEVAFAGAISGSQNIMAAVLCRNTDGFYNYLSTRIAGLPGITNYEVSVTTRRVKQAGSIIAGGRLVHPPRPAMSRTGAG